MSQLSRPILHNLPIQIFTPPRVHPFQKKLTSWSLTPSSTAPGSALTTFALVCFFSTSPSPFAFFEGAGIDSSSSSSPSTSAVFLALFLEAGVAVALGVPVFLLGVLGSPLPLLLFWMLEERAPYLGLLVRCFYRKRKKKMWTRVEDRKRRYVLVFQLVLSDAHQLSGRVRSLETSDPGELVVVDFGLGFEALPL